MIDKKLIEDIVNQNFNSDSEFIVDISVSSANKIFVVIDSDSGITIDRCVDISRAIEQQLDRDKEDFELEVASAGLSEPLKIARQYSKNIGRNVDVVLLDGAKKTGKLLSASLDGFQIEVQEKELVEGKKRKQLVTKTLSLAYADVKSTKIVISFR
jgi:ribosome maturation factor RimP